MKFCFLPAIIVNFAAFLILATMKNRSIHIFPFLFSSTIVSLALFSSCGTGTKWNDIQFYNVEKAEQVTETPRKVEDNYLSQIIDTTEYNIDVQVDMQFMKSDNVDNENVCRLINDQLIEIVLKQSSELSIDEAIDKYIAETKAELGEDPYGYEIYKHITGRAEYGKQNIIIYRVDTELYTGGAHPYTLQNILSFDATTGEYIDLDKVFAPLHHYSITKLLTTKLIQDLGKNSLAEIQEEGYLDMIEMFVSPNFALREDSVEFYYNQYDIAPYSCGPVSICLDYKSLQPYISTEFEVDD